MNRQSIAVCMLVILAMAGPAAAQQPQQRQEAPPIRSTLFTGLPARAIGPATMSGRIAAIDAVPGERLTIWVGSAGGGVWKSDDGGTRFRSVFDDHTQSIGAIAVDPSSPDTVWVGTGEAWTRNSVSVGDGVYRTTDGGDKWENMGLKDSEHIARIVVDPQDGKTVYVCALGHLWSTGGQRGVFRTKDGGKTWENVLKVDDKTGCSDLAIDPQEPNILYAGMWQVRRWPWKFESGGPGSGLYRSRDGGDTWQELKNGLPAGEKGRIAVAPAPSRPSVVYALVEAKKTALYRSDDLGEHWAEVNASTNVQMRPFYFGLIVPDPVDFNRVYKPGLTLSVSRDGGKSFTSPFTALSGGAVHSDLHALWINPKDPQQLVLGTDGGVYISDDRGGRWRMVRSLPVGQFYEVGYDMAYPYNVYGGLQDNGSWMGPSAATGGVQNRDWDNIGFGDGFHAYPDPADSDYVFSEYQGGNLLRYQRSTGELKQIRPYAEAGQPKLRFNWNTPLFVSRAHPGTLYYGAQYLFRSRDHGESWQRISPDLTTNDPSKQKQAESGGLTIDNSSAENYTTIYTISESPLSDSVVWVGTDDGNLQLTRNGGGSWTNVVHNVRGVPDGTWVSHVEASPHDVATAFVTFDGHRLGDMTTYAYRTTDFGNSWQRLDTDSVEGYAHVIKQDPVNPNLLFLGTEWGLWLSLDGGASWARYDSGLPERVAVRDLAIQPREHDLIIGTHGRGIYILDDLTPIRHLTPEVLASDVAILPSRPAIMTLEGQTQEFNGDDEFVGQNPPQAASIVYYQKKRHLFGDLFVQVYDSAGKAVSNPIPGTKQAGINRVEWPMRMPAPKMPPATALIPTFVGPRVPEGSYKFTLTKGKNTYDGTVRLVPDPRNKYTVTQRALQQQTAMQLYDMLERLSYVVDATIDLRDRAHARADSVGGRSARRLNAYADELDSFRKGLVATSEAGMLSGEEKLREYIGDVYGAVVGYDGPPTASQIARTKALDSELAAAEKKFAGLANGRLGLAPMTKEEWRAKR
ncbi:MAG: glycosyl hydrolase [Gemmatimonadota bacterium]